MTAIANTGTITAPAIQAFDVELDGGLALGCEEVVPADGEVLVAEEKTLDATGDGKELAERVIVVATVANTYKLYPLANCGRLTGLNTDYGSVLYIEKASQSRFAQMICVSTGRLSIGNC
jgi:hypothetical protein